MRKTLLLFLLLIATCSVYGQFWLTSVVPNPNMPTDCAPLAADISGNLPGSNYAVTSSNNSVVGFNITINLFITQSGFGNPVILPFTYSEPLGILGQGGTYTVTTNYYLSGNLTETNISTFVVSSCCYVNAAFSTNSDTLCLGDTLLLTNSSTSATSYQWKENGSPFSTSANTSIVFPTAGTYTVTLVASDSCTDSTSRSILVQNCCNVTSSFTTNGDTLCYGDTLLLTSSSTGAITYNWEDSGGSFATGPTASLVLGALGPLTVDLIASDSNCSDTSSSTVQVVDCCTDIPDFTLSDSAICLSDSSITAFNTSTGADNWTWLLDNQTVSTDTNHVFTFSAPGNYQISLITFSGFACSDTVSRFVTIAANPSAGYTALPTGLCVQFTDASMGASAWTWDFGDGNSDNVSSPQHCYANPGTYTVCQIALSGACTDTICQQVTVDTLVGGLGEWAGFQLFPNPASDFVELTVAGEVDLTLDLFDMAGRLALHLEPGVISRTRLELSEIPAGLYLLRIRSADKTAHQRLLIKR